MSFNNQEDNMRVEDGLESIQNGINDMYER
jgi:hypothetical protein